MLRLMYNDGGLYRAYRAFMVLRLMYSDGGLYRAFRAFRVLRLMYSDGGHLGCRGSCIVIDGYIGHIGC